MTTVSRGRPYFGRPLLGMLFFFLLPAMLMVIGLGWQGDNGQLFSLAIALLIVSCSSAFLYVRDGGLVQPLLLVLFSVGMGVLGKLIYLIDGYGQNSRVDEFLLLGLDLDSLAPGLFFSVAALFCMLLAYMLPANSSFSRPQQIYRNFGGTTVLIISLGILIVGLLAFVAYVLISEHSVTALSAKRFAGGMPSDRFGSIEYYLFKAASLTKVAFYLFVLSAYSNANSKSSSLPRLLALIAFLSSALIASYFSNRASIVILLFDYLIIAYLFYRGFKSTHFFGVIGVILALFAVSEMRSAQGAEKEMLDHAFGGRYFFDLTKNAHIFNYLSSGASFTDTNIAAENLSLFNTYANLGRTAGESIFHMKASGVPIGFPAEAYALGGWPSLIVLMAGFGFVLRLIGKIIARPEVDDYLVVVYAIFTTRISIYMFNNGLGVTIYQVFLDLVPLAAIVFMYLAFKKNASYRLLTRS